MTSSHSVFISHVYRHFSWKEKKDASPFSTQLFIQDLLCKAREHNTILASAESRIQVPRTPLSTGKSKNQNSLHKLEIQKTLFSLPVQNKRSQTFVTGFQYLLCYMQLHSMAVGSASTERSPNTDTKRQAQVP